MKTAQPDEPVAAPGAAEEAQRFPATVIRFDSRPRLMVGDVVELCRNCLPSNRGKLAIVEGFQKDGRVRVRSTFLPFDTVDSDTREPTGRDMTIYMPPENLYRRSSTLKGH